MNTFGKYFRLTTFGESHGVAMGAVIDGCPANIPFSLSLLKSHLDKRRPGKFPWQTSRNEQDDPRILSGVFQDKTLGTPISIIVENHNQRSQDYEMVQKKPRTGHADDLWKSKYRHFDPRGGGRASGRETVSRVMGGAVAFMFLKEVLKDFQILSFADQIGSFKLETSNELMSELWSNPDKLEEYPCYFPNKGQSEKVKDLLLQAKKEGKSYGGSVEIYIRGIPQNLGQPVFGKLKSLLTDAFMGVGAVCGVFVGCEPQDVTKEGSEFHESSTIYGGIRGGISTGETMRFKVYFKPPSSIKEVALQGRHDPCIIPRAIPVLEAMVYLVMADLVLARRLDC